MVKTMQPGEGDDMSRQAEIDMLEAMMADPVIDERRLADSVPIGRHMLMADIFGTTEYPAPFQLPQSVPPLLRPPAIN